MDILLAFWLGSCLGSFLNVIVYRLPKDRSIISPRSYCPRCRKPIVFYDNIPILSWFWLKGRCRSCRAGISARYPAVELLAACLSAGIWLRWKTSPFWAASAALAAGALVAIALIDWDTFEIPDELSLGLLAVGLLAAPINPYFAAARPWSAVGASALGGLTGFLICWLTAELGERLFKKEAMGGGDIKLLSAVGAWTGALGAFDCLLIASFLGSVYGLSRIARGTLRRSDPIAFGPFLSLGAVFNLFYLLPLGFPFA